MTIVVFLHVVVREIISHALADSKNQIDKLIESVKSVLNDNFKQNLLQEEIFNKIAEASVGLTLSKNYNMERLFHSLSQILRPVSKDQAQSEIPQIAKIIQDLSRIGSNIFNNSLSLSTKHNCRLSHFVSKTEKKSFNDCLSSKIVKYVY